MDNAKSKKLQYLIINQLLKEGTVSIILPDGVTLEIGITQEDEHGGLQKTEDYCYVVASRGNKSVMLDSFNLGLQFEADDDTIICETDLPDDDGTVMRAFDVV